MSWAIIPFHSLFSFIVLHKFTFFLFLLIPFLPLTCKIHHWAGPEHCPTKMNVYSLKQILCLERQLGFKTSPDSGGTGISNLLSNMHKNGLFIIALHYLSDYIYSSHIRRKMEYWSLELPIPYLGDCAWWIIFHAKTHRRNGARHLLFSRRFHVLYYLVLSPLTYTPESHHLTYARVNYPHLPRIPTVRRKFNSNSLFTRTFISLSQGLTVIFPTYTHKPHFFPFLMLIKH